MQESENHVHLFLHRELLKLSSWIRSQLNLLPAAMARTTPGTAIQVQNAQDGKSEHDPCKAHVPQLLIFIILLWDRFSTADVPFATCPHGQSTPLLAAHWGVRAEGGRMEIKSLEKSKARDQPLSPRGSNTMFRCFQQHPGLSLLPAQVSSGRGTLFRSRPRIKPNKTRHHPCQPFPKHPGYPSDLLLTE